MTSDAIEGRGAPSGDVDTDGDRTPDWQDLDSDNDGILDSVEWLAPGCPATLNRRNDVDNDGIPNFRDLDSDGDSVPDACEARGHANGAEIEIALPVLDTDGDGSPDYLDRDADGDLLVDGTEDKNGSCATDVGETDRLKADTDGDETSDFIEVTLLGVAAAKDPTQSPTKAGMLYFLVPWAADGSAAAAPVTSVIAASTRLNKVDLGIVVDTTASMNGEMANLKSTLSNIVSQIAQSVPDVGVGVAGHDDVPSATYGACTDSPFYVPTNGTLRAISTAGIVDGAALAEAQTAVNGLALGGGNDLPESQIPALTRALRGDALSWAAGGCAAAGSMAAIPATTSLHGALQFRTSALSILVSLRDIPRLLARGSVRDAQSNRRRGRHQ